MGLGRAHESSCTAHRGRNNTRGRSPGSQPGSELPGPMPSRAVVHAQWLAFIGPDAATRRSVASLDTVAGAAPEFAIQLGLFAIRP